MSDLTDRFRRALEGLVGVPATEGNAVDVLRNGTEIFPAMLDAIEGAERTVDFLTYVYWQGDIAQRFARALSGRAADGVRVRVLLDAVGAAKMNKDLVEDMRAAGCRVEFFRPVQKSGDDLTQVNRRTHRKLLVCDEDVAFTGGVGIAEEWEGDANGPHEWRDTHLRVRGPAVDGLRAAFALNWGETGQPLLEDGIDTFPLQPQVGSSVIQVVSCPAQFGWSGLATLMDTALRLATDRIAIAAAYFVPNQHFRGLLADAVARGVEVDVLVPGSHHDKRVVQLASEDCYEELLDAGVRVHCYERTMLHCKLLTVDGVLACVGSANFDERSLRLNEECHLAVIDADLVAVLDAHFTEDLRDSIPLDPQRWAERGVVQRVAERVAGLFEDQL